MSLRARIISIIVGVVALAIVSFLVRRRRLYNVYAITWFLISLMFIAMGVIPNFVEGFAEILGISFPPAAILVVAIGCVMAISLHLSMIVTEQHKHIRNYEKEIALLKAQSPTTPK